MQTELLNDQVSTRLPSPADPAVVSGLVRGFAKNVFKSPEAWHRGEVGAHEPLITIEADARRFGAIFLGRNPAYDEPPWNTPDRLGNVFKVLFPEGTDRYGDRGAACFMWPAAQLASGAKALEIDPQAEELVKRRLDAIIEDLIARQPRGNY